MILTRGVQLSAFRANTGHTAKAQERGSSKAVQAKWPHTRVPEVAQAGFAVFIKPRRMQPATAFDLTAEQQSRSFAVEFSTAGLSLVSCNIQAKDAQGDAQTK
eukprot:3089942-Amphidinium_carterae.1